MACAKLRRSVTRSGAAAHKKKYIYAVVTASKSRTIARGVDTLASSMSTAVQPLFHRLLVRQSWLRTVEAPQRQFKPDEQTQRVIAMQMGREGSTFFCHQVCWWQSLTNPRA